MLRYSWPHACWCSQSLGIHQLFTEPKIKSLPLIFKLNVIFIQVLNWEEM